MKIKDYFDSFTTFTGKAATLVAAGFFALFIGVGAILWGVGIILKLLSEIGVPLVEDMSDYINTILVVSMDFFGDWIWYAILFYAGGILVLGTIDYLIRRSEK